MEVLSAILALCEGNPLIHGGRGDVDTVNSEFIYKDQLPSHAPSWIHVLGVDHLTPDDPERMLCPVL